MGETAIATGPRATPGRRVLRSDNNSRQGKVISHEYDYYNHAYIGHEQLIAHETAGGEGVGEWTALEDGIIVRLAVRNSHAFRFRECQVVS